MELRHLRYFVAVADAGGFRRAAERLHISQPPLSQQIRGLESELGVDLFARSGRGVELTPAGEAFLSESRGILEAVERATDLTRRIGRGETGQLSVAFVGSSLFGVFPLILRAFRAERPDVELRLRELATGLALEAIADGQIDVGVVRPSRASTDLGSHVIERERVLVALAQTHRLAGATGIEPRDLWNERLILLGPREAPGLHEALSLAFEPEGGLPPAAQQVSEIQTVLALVAAGLGISLVPESAATLTREGVAFRALVGRSPTVDLALVWHEDARSPVLDAFLDVARRAAHRGRSHVSPHGPPEAATNGPRTGDAPGEERGGAAAEGGVDALAKVAADPRPRPISLPASSDSF